MIANDLSHFQSLDEVRRRVASECEQAENQNVASLLGKNAENSAELHYQLADKLEVALDKALNQYVSLCDEAAIHFSGDVQGQQATKLELIKPVHIAAGDEALDVSRCIFSRKSIGDYLMPHDMRAAARLTPLIECSKNIQNGDDDEKPTETSPKVENEESSTSPKIAKKTINSYLKTIAALSDCILDGLTGAPTKDAQAVLMALEAKGIEGCVGQKTLAKYLTDAKELV